MSVDVSVVFAHAIEKAAYLLFIVLCGETGCLSNCSNLLFHICHVSGSLKSNEVGSCKRMLAIQPLTLCSVLHNLDYQQYHQQSVIMSICTQQWSLYNLARGELQSMRIDTCTIIRTFAVCMCSLLLTVGGTC